jgi:hypothetical protein
VDVDVMPKRILYHERRRMDSRSSGKDTVTFLILCV